MKQIKTNLSLLTFVIATSMASQSIADSKYGPGVTDTEIKIGNIVPYSGKASAYGALGIAEAAYFQMINDRGGINGRKITFVSRDDGYNPAKTVEQARKLVEQDNVLLIFGSIGTAPNSAIQKYMNNNQVPQLFVASGATKWGSPKEYPWTMGFTPSYHSEAKVFVNHILATNPDAKIGILYQNDDYGKDYLQGVTSALGEKDSGMIVSLQSYQMSDPTVDNQIFSLKADGVDTLITIATSKFATQTIKKLAELGWKPAHYLNSVGSSAKSVMVPAGGENGTGIISTSYLKDPADPQWASYSDVEVYNEWAKKYVPGISSANTLVTSGYIYAQALVQVLTQAGDNLTRDNIMKQAANLKDVQIDMMLPGIKVNTSSTDFFPVENSNLKVWNGDSWKVLANSTH